MTERKFGILMPLASLPNKYGIGDFGPQTYEFIDILASNKVDLWQILPLNPLGYGKSPYQPYSSYAMDELYISLELLKDMGLLKTLRNFNENGPYIDYDGVLGFKNKYLKRAYRKFIKNKVEFITLHHKFSAFKKHRWVKDYATFITFKKQNNLLCWNEWDDEYKLFAKTRNKKLLSKHNKDIEYEMFVQFILNFQFNKFKNYLHKNNIKLIGDLPFYVGIDSDDVYFNQDEYLLDEDGIPTHIAGVPPDYFCVTGQRWGNPIYDWNKMKKNNYKAWFKRISHNAKMYDVIRLDHFRAFDTYWKIDSSCDTAIEGEWVENDGNNFFSLLYKKYPNIQMIVEDLGDIRKEVTELKDNFKLKGMRVLEFALDLKTDNKGIENEVFYSSTHDNETLYSWFYQLPVVEQEKIIEYLNEAGYKHEKIVDNLINLIIDAKSEYRIIPLADVLGLDDTARINTPGTLGAPNWMWRITDYNLVKHHFALLKQMIESSEYV